jgi:hypothetical protein
MKLSRTPITILLGLAAALELAARAGALTLAEAGRPTATIVRAAGATASEEMAANEIAEYPRRITGATLQVQPEANAPAEANRVFVGPTAFAKSQGLTADKLGAEEWIIRTFGNDLVIMGGQPRGTIYGAYHFLEDVLGVHWWNPFEESVPHQETLRIGPLSLHGKPALPYRDIYMLYGHDEGRFATRNRLNREGDARIAARYGGCRDYGPPYHVHTFNLYFPPKEFFPRHAEWYSLVNGKRVAEGGQLCLTQPELRNAFHRYLVGRGQGRRCAPAYGLQRVAKRLPQPVPVRQLPGHCQSRGVGMRPAAGICELSGRWHQGALPRSLS